MKPLFLTTKVPIMINPLPSPLPKHLPSHPAQTYRLPSPLFKSKLFKINGRQKYYLRNQNPLKANAASTAKATMETNAVTK